MKDVMIDIETPNNAPDSAVLTVGAVYFDRKTGVTGKKFYGRISYDDAIKYGTVSGDTIKWWSEQSPEAREEAFGGTESARDVAISLSDFIDQDAEVWGNGSIFDITILENWYRQLNIEIPWEFWNVRDVRTIVSWFDIDRSKFKRVGTHHNAIDDCLYQIEYMCNGAR